MPNPASSKKRKVETGPKYYAVKAGFEPGVYTQYSDCQRQTAGFKGAICTFSIVDTSVRFFDHSLLTYMKSNRSRLARMPMHLWQERR